MIEILVGTTSGNTEFVAEELQQHLINHQLQCRLHDEPQLDELTTDTTSFWLICVATHGAGDVADSMLNLVDQLTTQKPDLSAVKGAILAIGDSSYDTFCEAGKTMEDLLSQRGMTFIVPRHELDMAMDMDPEGTATQWLTSWKDQI